MKALVTGCAGFIGSHLTERLLRDNLEVVGIVVDNLLGHVERRETSGFRLVPVSRYPLFIGAALIALALSLAVRIIRWQDMF